MRPYPHRRPRPLRYIPPGIHTIPWVTKADFACCVAYRDNHPEHRWAIGDCGPECLRKAWRHEQFASTDDGPSSTPTSVVNPQESRSDNPQPGERTIGTISAHTEDHD